MNAGGNFVNSTVANFAGISPFAAAPVAVNIPSFCKGVSPHAVYFSNPIHKGLSAQGVTKASIFAHEVALQSETMHCAGSCSSFDLQNHHVADICLIGAFLILGVFSDRAKAAFKSASTSLRSKAADRASRVLRYRTAYADTAAYQVAENLLPLFQIHEKLIQADWKWYTDHHHQDRLYVLSCIAAGHIEGFDKKDVSVSKYLRNITVAIEGKDGERVKTVEITGLTKDHNVKGLVFVQLLREFAKEDWYSNWFLSSSPEDRFAICSRIINSEGDLDVEDASVAHIAVIHGKPVITMKYNGEEMEIDLNRRPSIWAMRSMMKKYSRRLRQVVKSREAVTMDDKNLAMWLLASLIARHISNMIVHGPKKSADVFERMVAKMLIDDPAFKTILPESVITRVIEDIKQARS